MRLCLEKLSRFQTSWVHHNSSLHAKNFPVKIFLSYPKPVLKIEGVVLQRVMTLEYFCTKQGQALKPSAALLYPKMGQVPLGSRLLCCSCLFYAVPIFVVVFNEVSNVIQLLLFLLCIILERSILLPTIDFILLLVINSGDDKKFKRSSSFCSWYSPFRLYCYIHESNKREDKVKDATDGDKKQLCNTIIGGEK